LHRKLGPKLPNEGPADQAADMREVVCFTGTLKRVTVSREADR
jgi:hypothetical protein